MTEQATDQETGQARGFNLSEGLVVAAIPVAAYLFAFAFEAGFATVYNIPWELITLSPTSVFIAGSSLLLVGATLLLVTDFISMLLPKTESPITVMLVLHAPMILFVVAMDLFMLGTPRQDGAIVASAFFLIVLLADFGLPLIKTQRTKPTYAERLRARIEQKSNVKGIFAKLASRLGGTYLLLYYLYLLLLITNYAGESVALRQRNFLVTDTHPEMVVLRIYSDKMICAPFDRNTKQVKSEFTLLKLSLDPIPTLRPEDVGPLTMQLQPTETSTSRAP